MPSGSAVVVPHVHAVTTDDIALRDDFPERAHRVMRALGPRGAVHLRAPRQPSRVLHQIALALLDAQSATGAWLVVNDRVDVALVSGARAVQLTSRSMTVSDARAIAPVLPIGASVHAVEEAERAAGEGADWAVAGHVFATRSHPGVPGRGIDMLRQMAARVGIPIIAIGGVFPAHVPLLRAAGAYGVAVIRGIWDADDAERAAIAYLSTYDADENWERNDHRLGER